MREPTPIDILEKAIGRGLISSVRRGPGEVVQRLSPEDREILQRLTSDAISPTTLRLDIGWPR